MCWKEIWLRALNLLTILDVNIIEGQVHDHFMSLEIFTLIMKWIFKQNSLNFEESGCEHSLDLVFSLDLVRILREVFWVQNEKCLFKTHAP